MLKVQDLTANVGFSETESNLDPLHKFTFVSLSPRDMSIALTLYSALYQK